MLLLGVKNTSIQTVATGGVVSLGTVYRRYCRNINGITTFSANSDSVSLNQKGMYKVTVTANVSAAAAGDITLQLYNNGVAVAGALATETITTATTEFHNMTIDYIFLVDASCLLGVTNNLTNSITVVNTSGIAATINNIVLNVEKIL